MIKTIFHHPAWFQVLKQTYGLEVKVIGQNSEVGGEKIEDRYEKSAASSQKSLVEGGIPFVVKKNKYISLSFSDYVSLLNTKEENDSIIAGIIKSNPKVEIEIRDKYEGNGFETKLVGYRHVLTLNKSEEDIFKSFKKTQIQQPIQKSIRDGLIFVIRKNYEAVNEFYKLHLLTRKKLGVPIQPKKFFYHLWNEIIYRDMGYVVLVYLEGKCISAGIFIGYDKILTYKFSASNPKFLKYRPNNLMLWTAIKEAKRHGFEIFDFGRTELNNEGLRKFKQGWGTIEEPLYYSYYPKSPKLEKFIFFKEKIVAPIIRKSPIFVCRITGELFYKYFG